MGARFQAVQKPQARAAAVATSSASRAADTSRAQDFAQEALGPERQPWGALAPEAGLPPSTVHFDFARIPLFYREAPAPEPVGPPVHVQRRCAACGTPRDELRIQRRCAKCDAEQEGVQRKADTGDSVQVGPPDDVYEREADRVAEAVMATRTASVAPASEAPASVSATGGGGAVAPAPAAKPVASAQATATARLARVASALVQRDGPDEGRQEEPAPEGTGRQGTPDPSMAGGGDSDGDGGDDEEGPEVQCQREEGAPAPGPVEPLSRSLRESRGDGRPLPAQTRGFMESRFGFDFSSVRIHSDVRAARMNESLGAYAFTSGQDIYFSIGQYRPGTEAGDRLLAHELTHVVQQSGGAAPRPMPMVQRATIPDRKPYTGTTVHHNVEQRLRVANTTLVTEAPIPGATADAVANNRLGSADLYRSAGQHVPDIRGDHRANRAGQLTFFPLTDARKRQTQSASGLTWSPSARENAPPRASTIIRHTDFPSSFEVADLKPLSTERLGGGLLQINNYMRGMGEFARAANAASVTDNDGTPTTVVPQGHALTTLTIPSGLDYHNFDPARPNHPSEGLVLNGRRIWIVNLGADPNPRLPGLFVYFDLDSEAPSSAQAQQYERLLASLLEIRNFVRQPNTPIGNNAGLPQPKRRPGITRVQRHPVRPGVRAAPHRRLQRTTDWRALGRQFEQRRRTWAREVRRFQRGNRRGLARRLQVDAALGIRRPYPAGRRGAGSDQSTDFRAMRFWSSAMGRFAGRIRFMLGSTFDSLAQRFQRMRERFQGWARRANAQGVAPAIGGWQRRLVNVLMRALKMGIIRFLSESFRIFVDCMNGLVAKAVRVLTDDASEEVRTQICELQRQMEELERRFQEEFERKFGSYDRLVETVSDAQQWLSIASSLITLLRVGFQVVSCLSPPALGCLWGLVGQVAIEVVLDLVMGTRWFEENIVRHPSVTAVIRRFVGPAYQGFIDEVLARAGLTAFASDVRECQLEVGEEMALGPAGGLDGSGLMAHRSAWEQRHMAELLAALGPLFRGSGGRRATEAELRQLLEAFRRSGKTAEQMRAQLEAMRPTPGAPVDVQALAQAIEGTPGTGTGTPATPPASPGPDRPAETAPRSTTGGGSPPATGPQTGGGGPTTQVVQAQPVTPSSRTPTSSRSYRLLGLPAGVRASRDTPVQVTVQLEVDGVNYQVEGVELYVIERIAPTRATGNRTQLRFYFARDWGFPGTNTVIFGGADRVYTYTLD